jgi:hypothetical protein
MRTDGPLKKLVAHLRVQHAECQQVVIFNVWHICLPRVRRQTDAATVLASADMPPLKLMVAAKAGSESGECKRCARCALSINVPSHALGTRSVHKWLMMFKRLQLSSLRTRGFRTCTR